MFKVNDTIMYGNNGVYRITDIRPEAFGGGEPILYYVLTHVDNDTLTVYCPVENSKVPLHRLLSVQEIYDLIKLMPDTQGEWIENDQKRNEAFTAILKSGNHSEMVKLIKTIHFEKEERSRRNKKLHIADERIMKEAERVLYEEFAHVLQITPDEVIPFITGEIDKLQSK